jgi:hypothetical protein
MVQTKTTVGFSISLEHKRFLEQWGWGRMSKALADMIEYYQRPHNPVPWIESVLHDYRMGLVDEEQTLTAYVTMKEQIKYFEESGLIEELKTKLGF